MAHPDRELTWQPFEKRSIGVRDVQYGVPVLALVTWSNDAIKLMHQGLHAVAHAQDWLAALEDESRDRRGALVINAGWAP
jgi:hypothetical protein